MISSNVTLSLVYDFRTNTVLYHFRPATSYHLGIVVIELLDALFLGFHH